MMKLSIAMLVCIFVCCSADPVILRHAFPNITHIQTERSFLARGTFTETTASFRIRTSEQYEWEVTLSYNGHNETAKFTTVWEKSILPADPFYKKNTTYLITIRNTTVVPKPIPIGVRYDEANPKCMFTLSDNEPFAEDLSQHESDGQNHYRYNTQAAYTHTVTQVHIEIFTYGYYSTAKEIYISTHEYPIPDNENTYFWSNKDLPFGKITSFDIKQGDAHFCGDTCSYYITVVSPTDASFALLANSTLDYHTLVENEIAEFVVSPESSTYFKVHVGSYEQRNVLLNFTFIMWVSDPYKDDVKEAGVTLFGISKISKISPGNAYWMRTTVNHNGRMIISNNDPRFCTDCDYYFRIDASPDQFIPMIGNISYYISHDFHPVYMLPDRYYHGDFVGVSLKEHKDMTIYIPQDNPDNNELVESIEFLFMYDEFVEQNLSVSIQNYYPDEPKPSSCPDQQWKANLINGTYDLYLTREDHGFCTGTNYYIIVNLTTTEGRETNWLVWTHYNVDLKELNSSVEDTSVCEPYTEGKFFYLNFTKYDLETNLTITVTSTEDIPLILYASISSFRDGNDTAEWQVRCTNKEPGTITITPKSPYYKQRGYYYFRVDHENNDYPHEVRFIIKATVEKPNPHQLNPSGLSPYYERKSSKPGRMYFALDSTAIEDDNGFYLNYTKVGEKYTSTLYISNVTFPGPVVHRYEYKQTIDMDENEFTFALTAGQAGYCKKCIIYFMLELPGDNIDCRFLIHASTFASSKTLYPNKKINNTIKGYSGAHLYNLQFFKGKKPTMKVILGRPHNKPDLYMAISTTDYVPNKQNCMWYEEALENFNATIDIDPTQDGYVDGGPFYIAVGPKTITSLETPYEIEWVCSGDDCQLCDDPHYDVSKECKDCLDIYYGSKCEKKCNCNHGSCNSGIKGEYIILFLLLYSGQCKCETGWAQPNCNECEDNYYGLQCKQCTINCNGNGKCNDGSHGDGLCLCDNFGLDPRTDCSSCYSGYFGEKCHGTCPGGNVNPCNGNGKCNDGWNGNGRCTCLKGYYGLDCSTVESNTTCKPLCVEGNGQCDESIGQCVCYDGHTGATCSDKKGMSFLNVMIIILGVVGGIILVGGIALFSLKYIRGGSVSKRKVKRLSLDAKSNDSYNLLDDI